LRRGGVGQVLGGWSRVAGCRRRCRWGRVLVRRHGVTGVGHRAGAVPRTEPRQAGSRPGPGSPTAGARSAADPRRSRSGLLIHRLGGRGLVGRWPLVGRRRWYLVLRLFVLFLLLRVLLLGLLGWRVHVLDGAGVCANVGGAGVVVGAGLGVTLPIGLLIADTVDIGATTDPVPVLVAELKRFAPADIAPDAPLPMKSITPLIESLLSPSWACSAVTPAAVVACSAGPCGAS
jgi:hypothetical protein